MTTENKKRDSKKKPNQIVADIPRLENDIYRVSRFINDRGICYGEIRVFYKKPDMDKFSGTDDRLSIEATVFLDLCGKVMKAKMAEPLPMPTGQKRSEYKDFGEVRVSEKKLFRISKVQGIKYRKVRIQQFSRNENGKCFPVKGKCLDVFEACVEDFVQALRNPAFQVATTQSVAA